MNILKRFKKEPSKSQLPQKEVEQPKKSINREEYDQLSTKREKRRFWINQGFNIYNFNLFLREYDSISLNLLRDVLTDSERKIVDFIQLSEKKWGRETRQKYPDTIYSYVNLPEIADHRPAEKTLLEDKDRLDVAREDYDLLVDEGVIFTVGKMHSTKETHHPISGENSVTYVRSKLENAESISGKAFARLYELLRDKLSQFNYINKNLVGLDESENRQPNKERGVITVSYIHKEDVHLVLENLMSRENSDQQLIDEMKKIFDLLFREEDVISYITYSFLSSKKDRGAQLTGANLILLPKSRGDEFTQYLQKNPWAMEAISEYDNQQAIISYKEQDISKFRWYKDLDQGKMVVYPTEPANSQSIQMIQISPHSAS